MLDPLSYAYYHSAFLESLKAVQEQARLPYEERDYDKLFESLYPQQLLEAALVVDHEYVIKAMAEDKHNVQTYYKASLEVLAKASENELRKAADKLVSLYVER